MVVRAFQNSLAIAYRFPVKLKTRSSSERDYKGDGGLRTRYKTVLIKVKVSINCRNTISILGNGKGIFYFSGHESKVRPFTSVVHFPSDMFTYPDTEKVKM